MNRIIRTLMCGGQISLTVMDTTRLVNDGIAVHSTPRSAAHIFGGMLTCGAFMAAQLKDGGACVSLTVKAKDGDGAVSVSGDSELHIRGYVDGTCTQTLVGGTLSVVREEVGATPFVGTCGLETDDVSEILATYYQQSEQIPTAVRIITEIGADGSCLCAGGVIMQLLPDADDEAVDKAGKAFYDFCDCEGAMLELGAEGVLEKFFSPLTDGEGYTLAPVYKCNCSENKIKSVLASVGKAELLNIVEEQGAVSVHCHYCNKDYVYDKDYIEKNF